MASSTGHPAPVSPETYWKRRVFVLAGVLVVVALLAWACQGFSSNGDEQQASVDPEESPQDSGSDPPAGEDTAEPSESEEPDPSPSDEADGGGGGGQGGSGGGGSAEELDIPRPRQAEDPCRPQDIVVTLGTDDTDYAGGEEPEIELSVVNIAEQTCTLDVGPANLEIVIYSGEDRVFSSLDCEDNGSRNEQLVQGRPHTTTITWDRMRSWEDCRDDERRAGSGTYQARLHSPYDNGAEAQVFRLN